MQRKSGRCRKCVQAPCETRSLSHPLASVGRKVCPYLRLQNLPSLPMIGTAMADLSKTYDPTSVEPKWYSRWIDNHDFEADPKSSKPAFSIVIPPPNITGVLTLGHVLNNTIQDILARRARMEGFEVLWLPGVDHAGIGTQTAVEKHLRRTEKKTRHDLGREEFLRRVLEWQDKHGGIIIEQP